MFKSSKPSICDRICSLEKPVPLMAPAGQAATQVPQPWQRAGLTSLTILIFVEEDGVEGAQVVADAAAGALFLVDGGAHRFQGDFLLLDLAQDAGGGSGALCHAGRDILGALDAAGDVDAFGHGGDRVQLGVPFDQPAVCAAGDAEQFGDCLRSRGGVPGRRRGSPYPPGCAAVCRSGYPPPG